MSIVMHQAPTWGRGEIVVHLNWETSTTDAQRSRVNGWNWYSPKHAWRVMSVEWWETE